MLRQPRLYSTSNPRDRRITYHYRQLPNRSRRAALYIRLHREGHSRSQ
jgi:hypothetical protein